MTTAKLPEDEATKPHISFSQMEMYKRCSLQYKFRYVDGIKSRPALALVNGKAGHTAVEADHRKKISTGENLPLEQILDTFDDAFEAELHELEPTDLKAGDDPGKTKDSTVETLKVYRVSKAPLLNPIAVEFAFNLDLPSNEYFEYPIRIANGRIDLLDRSGVFDNKFPMRRTAKSQEDADLSWQLTLYDMVMADAGIDVPNLGFISFLPPSPAQKKPAEIVMTGRSQKELEPAQRQRRRDRLVYTMRTIEREIAAGIARPADDPKVCAWCGYREMCQYSLAKSDYDALLIRQAS